MKTTLSDLVLPTIFAPYALHRTAAHSALLCAGIVGLDHEFNLLATGPGKTVDLPFWKDLEGTSEVLSDTGTLSVSNLVASQDTAAIHSRGRAWGANLLVHYLSGDDPVRRLGDLVGAFWARDLQSMLLDTLLGLFDPTAGPLRESHLLDLYQDLPPADITDAMCLTGHSFIDATVKLGDQAARLTAIAMHSEVEAFLRKRDLIDTRPDSHGRPTLLFFQGRRVVLDDTCPKIAGTHSPAYTTYLFGNGAFALGFARLPPHEAVETQRAALASDEYLVVRRRFILHPRGVRWIGAIPGASPSNADLATPAHWAKAYADKNIRLVAIRHNLC